MTIQSRTINIKAECSEPVITPYLNGYSYEQVVVITSPVRYANKPVRRFVIKPVKLWLKTPDQG